MEGCDHFDCLPDEVFQLIFLAISDCKSLIRCMAVSKTFREYTERVPSLSIVCPGQFSNYVEKLQKIHSMVKPFRCLETLVVRVGEPKDEPPSWARCMRYAEIGASVEKFVFMAAKTGEFSELDSALRREGPSSSHTEESPQSAFRRCPGDDSEHPMTPCKIDLGKSTEERTSDANNSGLGTSCPVQRLSLSDRNDTRSFPDFTLRQVIAPSNDILKRMLPVIVFAIVQGLDEFRDSVPSFIGKFESLKRFLLVDMVESVTVYMREHQIQEIRAELLRENEREQVVEVSDNQDEPSCTRETGLVIHPLQQRENEELNSNQASRLDMNVPASLPPLCDLRAERGKEVTSDIVPEESEDEKKSRKGKASTGGYSGGHESRPGRDCNVSDLFVRQTKTLGNVAESMPKKVEGCRGLRIWEKTCNENSTYNELGIGAGSIDMVKETASGPDDDYASSSEDMGNNDKLEVPLDSSSSTFRYAPIEDRGKATDFSTDSEDVGQCTSSIPGSSSDEDGAFNHNLDGKYPGPADFLNKYSFKRSLKVDFSRLKDGNRGMRVGSYRRRDRGGDWMDESLRRRQEHRMYKGFPARKRDMAAWRAGKEAGNLVDSEHINEASTSRHQEWVEHAIPEQSALHKAGDMAESSSGAESLRLSTNFSAHKEQSDGEQLEGSGFSSLRQPLLLNSLVSVPDNTYAESKSSNSPGQNKELEESIHVHEQLPSESCVRSVDCPSMQEKPEIEGPVEQEFCREGNTRLASYPASSRDRVDQNGEYMPLDYHGGRSQGLATRRLRMSQREAWREVYRETRGQRIGRRVRELRREMQNHVDVQRNGEIQRERLREGVRRRQMEIEREALRFDITFWRAEQISAQNYCLTDVSMCIATHSAKPLAGPEVEELSFAALAGPLLTATISHVNGQATFHKL